MKNLLLAILTILLFVGNVEAQQSQTITAMRHHHAAASIALVGSWGSGFANATSAQTGTGGTGPTAVSCAAGDTEIVGVMSTGSGTLTFTDSASNSGWNSYSTPYLGTESFYTTIGYNLNLGSSNTYAKVSIGTAANMWIVAGCYSGLTGHTDFTQVDLSNTSDGTAWASGTFTTTHAAELVVSITNNSNPSATLAPTSPALLGKNWVYADTLSSTYTIYSGTQTGQTQTGTLGAAYDFDVITAGFY